MPTDRRRNLEDIADAQDRVDVSSRRAAFSADRLSLSFQRNSNINRRTHRQL